MGILLLESLCKEFGWLALNYCILFFFVIHELLNGKANFNSPITETIPEEIDVENELDFFFFGTVKTEHNSKLSNPLCVFVQQYFVQQWLP